MASNLGIEDTLFGTPIYDLQEKRANEMRTRALEYAKLTPEQRSMMTLYGVGGSLAGAVNDYMGWKDPRVQATQRAEQAAQGLDFTNPQAILERAQTIDDPRLRMRLIAIAQQQEAAQREAAYKAQQTRLNEAKAEREMALAEKALLGETEGKYLTPVEKLIAARDRLPPGDPNRAVLDAAIRKETYIKPEKASAAASGMTANELRQQKYEDSLREKVEKKEAAAQSGLDAWDAVRRNIHSLYDPKTNKLRPEATSLFGRVDQFRGPLALSAKSADALTALTGLKDQITMSNLAEAKKMVGQSFGSMQVQEWDKFVRLISSLDRSMSEDTAAANLKFVLDFIDKKSDVLRVALGGNAPIQPTPTPTKPVTTKPSGAVEEWVRGPNGKLMRQ